MGQRRLPVETPRSFALSPARSCLARPFTSYVVCEDHGGDRFITVGFLDGAMAVVVWTLRSDGYRIIGNDEEGQMNGNDDDSTVAAATAGRAVTGLKPVGGRR